MSLGVPVTIQDPSANLGTLNLVGRTIARRYQIQGRIGGGGMGDVYSARHVELGFMVAIKIMRADLAKERGFKERFYREAKAASSLEHRNSVRVLDYGQEPDGLVYLAMEYLRGRDLRSLLRDEGSLSDERIVDILGQTLAAISVAHARGIVHRDLKPENIMIVADDDDPQRDCIKVCDFGIAKVLPEASTTRHHHSRPDLTGGALIGTPDYMSPEQARGVGVDSRSDIYSIGVVLYRLLAGRTPFAGENALWLAAQHVTQEPLPPSRTNPNVNPRLEAICLRAMQKDPAARHASAKEMRAELRAAIAAPPQASSAGALAVDSSPSWVAAMDNEVVVPLHSNRPAIAGVVMGFLTIAAILTSIAFLKRHHGEPPTAEAPSLVTPGATEVAAGIPAPPLPPIASAAAATETSKNRAPPSPSKRSRFAKGSLRSAISAPRSGEGAAPAAIPTAPRDYSPNRALVSLGALTTERVKRDVLAQKLAELLPRLNDCYRDSLFVVGSPLGGTASLNLSIDAEGHAVTVVTTNDLPPFARCASRVLAPLALPREAVDSTGGVAEQVLKLIP
jgi:serine/threonine-protein kinase